MTSRSTAGASRGDFRHFSELQFAFATTRVVSSALQLQVFSKLAAGATTAGAAAQAYGAPERGVRMLLDALVGLQLLSKQNGRYALTEFSERYLVSERADYAGQVLERDALPEVWGRLTDVIRTGTPVHAVDQQTEAEHFFPLLVQSLHIQHREAARRLAEALHEERGDGIARGLDVACGSAVWSIAYAERHSGTKITAQDFPGMIDTARTFVERHGVAAQFEFLPGDLNTVDFGRESYDIAWLGNIVHSEGEEASRRLFSRLYPALRPGGQLAIIDFLPDDERTGPLFPLLFALNMLVNTSHGDTFTLAQYRQWLGAAGFEDVHTLNVDDAPVGTRVVLARRP
ncbi:class I SAM-dependent methyltransferase [bacterium]|nr:MAG: class I SAM-dependent methyltransferase [bacterium]